MTVRAFKFRLLSYGELFRRDFDIPRELSGAFEFAGRPHQKNLNSFSRWGRHAYYNGLITFMRPNEKGKIYLNFNFGAFFPILDKARPSEELNAAAIERESYDGPANFCHLHLNEYFLNAKFYAYFLTRK